jgi:nucleotidyltransferase/DNA polymerase involved in DNA repair
MKRSSPERDREWYKGGGDRGGYIVEKRYKLGKQFARGVELKDDFMKGVAVWIDGKPESISVEELRRMILETGGNFYASPCSAVTHVLVEHLPYSKVERFRKLPLHSSRKYVSPKWLVDSYERGRKLSVGDYIPEQLRTKGQRQINQVFEKNNDKKKKGEGWAGPNPTLKSTRSDPDFVRKYLKKSRLHFIGSWRDHLEDLPRKVEEIRRNNTDIRRKTTNNRLVLHVDMDCFFVQVAMLEHKHVRKDSPVVVAHGGNHVTTTTTTTTYETRGCEISSANYAARKFGIKAGMGVKQAKRVCSDLIVLPYSNWKTISKISMTFYETILTLFPNGRVQPLSIDELYVSFAYDKKEDNVEMIMSKIRNRVRDATGGLECSIGAALNSPIYARMATKDAKPSGQKFVSNPKQFVSQHALRDLPGVGRAISKELERNGYTRCAEIQHSRLDSSFLLNLLKQWFGNVVGENIWLGARGDAKGTIKDILEMEKDQIAQSVSVEVNWGVSVFFHSFCCCFACAL